MVGWFVSNKTSLSDHNDIIFIHYKLQSNLARALSQSQTCILGLVLQTTCGFDCNSAHFRFLLELYQAASELNEVLINSLGQFPPKAEIWYLYLEPEPGSSAGNKQISEDNLIASRQTGTGECTTLL